MHIAFTKYEGTGNDFILIDDRREQFAANKELIASLCNRHFGIGADGLMTLRRSADFDCTMRYFNSDGSEGEMCGNGARCFTLFAHHLGIGGKTKYFRATDGTHTAQIVTQDSFQGEIELGMIPVTEIHQGEGWWFLNTGVPHYVEFVEDLLAVDVVGRGGAIRHDTTRFPHGTNVNFVQIIAPGELQMRTFERGVEQETLACGTGATAAAIIANYAFQPTVTTYHIGVPGGKLCVIFTHSADTTHYTNIRLCGAARRVFGGELDTDHF